MFCVLFYLLLFTRLSILVVLSVDAMDVSGEQHLDVEHNIFKQRLNQSGFVISNVPEKEGEFALSCSWICLINVYKTINCTCLQSAFVRLKWETLLQRAEIIEYKFSKGNIL